jgi:hypothetical protein
MEEAMSKARFSDKGSIRFADGISWFEGTHWINNRPTYLHNGSSTDSQSSQASAEPINEARTLIYITSLAHLHSSMEIYDSYTSINADYL